MDAGGKGPILRILSKTYFFFGDGDGDGDGRLSFEEVQAGVEALSEDLFLQLDTDRDGALTLSEVKGDSASLPGCFKVTQGLGDVKAYLADLLRLGLSLVALAARGRRMRQ